MMNVAIVLLGFLHLTISQPNQPIDAPSNILHRSSSNFSLCIEADLYEIESLKNEVFKNLPLNGTRNKKDSPFGLLDEDWDRLYKLEEMLPKESKLKTKLVKAFRLLISALNQAYSKPVLETGDDHGSTIITSTTTNASTHEQNIDLSDRDSVKWPLGTAFNNKSNKEEHDDDDDDDYEGAGSDKQETQLVFSLPPDRADTTTLPLETTKLVVNFDRSISTDITTQKIVLNPNYNIPHRNNLASSDTDIPTYLTTTTDIQVTDFDEEIGNSTSASTGRLDNNGESQGVTTSSYINAHSTPFKNYSTNSFDTQSMNEEFTPGPTEMSKEEETTEQELFPDVPPFESTSSISNGKIVTPFETFLPTTTLFEDEGSTGNVNPSATYYTSDKNVIPVITTNTTTESTENPTLNVNQSTTNVSVSKSVTTLVTSIPSADSTEDPTSNVEQSTLFVPGGKNLTPFVTTFPTIYVPDDPTVKVDQTNVDQTSSSIGHSKSSTPLIPITTTDLPDIFTGNVDPGGSNISNEKSLNSSTIMVTTSNKYYDPNNESKYTAISRDISTSNYYQNTQEAPYIDQTTTNQVVISSTPLEIFEPTFTTNVTEDVKESSNIVTSTASEKGERTKNESEGKNNTNNPTTEMTPKEEINTTSTTKLHHGTYPSYFDNDLYEDGFSKDGVEKGKDFPDSNHEEDLPENKGGFDGLGDEEQSSARTKESFKYFTVKFKKILEKHDPDIRRNRLGMYQKKVLPVRNPHQKSLSTCRNKNGCVQVQNYQYLTPFYETSKLQTSTNVPKHLGIPYEMVRTRGDIDPNTDVLTRSKRKMFIQNLLKS